MTNEELYQLMKDGFDQIRLNFDRVNQRLDRVDQRLDGMDTRLRTVENGISELTGKQQAISGNAKLDNDCMRYWCRDYLHCRRYFQINPSNALP